MLVHSTQLIDKLTRLNQMNILHLKKVLLCIGICLTLWRGYECFQKYLYSNLSTKVSMLKSSETFMPSLVICPSYFSAYNQRFAQKDFLSDILLENNIIEILSLLESRRLGIIDWEIGLGTHPLLDIKYFAM